MLPPYARYRLLFKHLAGLLQIQAVVGCVAASVEFPKVFPAGVEPPAVLGGITKGKLPIGDTKGGGTFPSVALIGHSIVIVVAVLKSAFH